MHAWSLRFLGIPEHDRPRLVQTQKHREVKSDRGVGYRQMKGTLTETAASRASRRKGAHLEKGIRDTLIQMRTFIKMRKDEDINTERYH